MRFGMAHGTLYSRTLKIQGGPPVAAGSNIILMLQEYQALKKQDQSRFFWLEASP
jgi:hypothetical protein